MLQNPFLGIVYKGPKLGKSEREAPKGEGGRPQEATLEKAQCLQLWKFSGCPPGGLGKRRRPRGEAPWRAVCPGENT